MEFKNKKILLICKETYSYPLFFLGEKWKKENTVAAFFFNPVECMYNRSYLNESTYYNFLDNKYTMFDSREIVEEFINMKSDSLYYEDYVDKIEREYSHFRSLNLQILSTQYLTRHYHFRNYMAKCSQEQQLNWIVLNYKNVERILDEYKPDIIIDCDNAELARIVLLEVAHVRNIPYLTMEYPRYESYKTYSYQLGIGIDAFFKKEYEHCYNLKDELLNEEHLYLSEYRKRQSIMPSEYQNTITATYEADSIPRILKRLFYVIGYFYNQDVEAKNLRLKKKCRILFNSSWEYIKFYFRVESVRRRLFKKNNLFESPVKGEKYVYMPLHLIPESTTFVKAPFYINELSVIEAVSKALPPTWKLYVKEHQAMIGERGIDFYKAVKKIPNVRLVQINYYNDPKPWINYAEGVITITGTSAYEAALMGKKALVFGDVMFGVIDGIEKVNSLEELPSLIKNFGHVENEHSCAAYIKAVKRHGKSINIKYLMSKGESIIKKNERFDDKFNDQLKQLEELYYDAYDNYLEEKEK